MLSDKVRAQTATRQQRFRERQKQARLQELQAKGLPATPPIPTMPSTARWNGLLEQSRATLETLSTEMREYYDNRTEQWQESEKGTEFESKMDSIESILESIS